MSSKIPRTTGTKRKLQSGSGFGTSTSTSTNATNIKSSELILKEHVANYNKENACVNPDADANANVSHNFMANAEQAIFDLLLNHGMECQICKNPCDTFAVQNGFPYCRQCSKDKKLPIKPITGKLPLKFKFSCGFVPKKTKNVKFDSTTIQTILPGFGFNIVHQPTCVDVQMIKNSYYEGNLSGKGMMCLSYPCRDCMEDIPNLVCVCGYSNIKPTSFSTHRAHCMHQLVSKPPGFPCVWCHACLPSELKLSAHMLSHWVSDSDFKSIFTPVQITSIAHDNRDGVKWDSDIENIFVSIPLYKVLYGIILSYMGLCL